MGESKFTYAWHIDNYFLCHLKIGEQLESPEFIVDSVFKNRWKISIYPRGYDEEHKEFCSVILERCSFGKKDITIQYYIDILKNNGDIIKVSGRGENKFDKKGFASVCTQFIKQDELLNKFDGGTVTFRCNIVIANKISGDGWATGCISRTRIGVDKFTFYWKIFACQKNSNWTSTKTFPFSKSSLLECSQKSSEDAFYVRIKKLKDGCNSRCITCKLTLLDKNKESFTSEKESFLFTEYNNCWELKSFVLNKSLMNKNETILRHNGYFNIKCDITISNGFDFHGIEQYTYNNINEDSTEIGSGSIDPTPKLSSELNELLLNKKHSDVQLQVDGTIIQAHKCILAARSPVFSAMFDCDMSENQSGIVMIEDTDVETMNDLMKFLYTEVVDMKKETALNLLAAADKYQVSLLKEKCSVFLTTILCHDNVCDILSVADLIGCVNVKVAAIDYIKGNASSILVTEKWLKWYRENDKLGNEIVSQIFVEAAKAMNKIS